MINTYPKHMSVSVNTYGKGPFDFLTQHSKKESGMIKWYGFILRVLALKILIGYFACLKRQLDLFI